MHISLDIFQVLFLYMFMDRDGVQVNKLAKKRMSPISSHPNENCRSSIGQRSPEARENQQHEMISDGAQTFGLNGTSVEMQSSGKAIGKTTDGEKTEEFRSDEMDYDKGVGKIIANQNKDLLSGEEDPKGACPVSDVLYDSLGMQQQMNLLRRLMFLMAALLLVVFLTAVASLRLYVTATTGKTLSSNQANSSQGMVVLLTRKCSQ